MRSILKSFLVAVLLSPPALVFGGVIEEIEKEHGIPDFSYAGYRRLEEPIPMREGPVFDVVDFGAIADDGKSDRGAIVKAISAATANGGGVVFFPKGRFDLNEIGDAETIRVSGSNIVLRGSGSGNGGTVLYSGEALPPEPPMRLWESPYAIEISPSSNTERATPITKSAKQGDLEIWVKDASALKAGDWICLSLLDNSPELIARELAGFQRIDPRWTSIHNSGMVVNERHQIEAVRGKRVLLKTPIVKAIDHQFNWNVNTFTPLSEIGVESIRFEGAWNGRFIHHRSWLDDGGYSLLKISNVVDSWVRDCVFANSNRPCGISRSAHVSVIDCRVEGTPGHSAINFQGSSYCLMARVEDGASQWHSLGVSKESMGNVIWKCFWNSDTCFESHSSQPRHTLFDSCVGGFMKGRGGGASSNLPTHLEGLVMWNHMKTNPPLYDFQFEPLDQLYWRILQPLIVGMHGTEVEFREGQSITISHGAPLKEGSLYERQLLRRFGKLPDDLAK